MSFSFIVDAQLPLSRDTELLDLADQLNRIIISKDADFYDSFILSGRPKKLLLITTGNISNQELLKIFEGNFKA